MGWYSANKRTLPWRSSRDPYKIWLSEIILQQTRVAQGIPYYLKFVNEFPRIEDLASASEERILKLWQGLGYYSRARNLHTTAKEITEHHRGKFPQTYNELISLKGIGDYTASAIASICFDRAEAVVDGNVYRVLSRYYGVDLPINSSAGIKYFKKLALEVMDRENIRDYNQGIMEFGAVQCVPVNPVCEACPLSESCMALSEGRVDYLPVKKKNKPVRKRYFNYLVAIDALRNTRLVQRTEKDIWRYLYEFPLLESKIELGESEVLTHCKELLQLRDIGAIYQTNPDSVIHKLSHQHLHTKFWIVRTKDKFSEGVPLEQIDQFPVPILIADFIKTFKNSYF